jgi:hypothetical protein
MRERHQGRGWPAAWVPGWPPPAGGLLAQPEIGQVHVIGAAPSGRRVEQHVRGFDVPVHQAPAVRRVQGGGHLGHDANGPPGGQRAPGVEERAHVGAGYVAYGDEQHAVGLTRGEDRDDVRVIHRGGGPGLADEPLLELLVPGQHRIEDLERDLPVQLEVVRAVDDSHPAAADLLIEPVPGHPRASRD